MCVSSWFRGWKIVFSDGDHPLLRGISLRDRCRLESRIVATLFRNRNFRIGCLAIVPAQLLILSLSWWLDLDRRLLDVLRIAPGLVCLPWLVMARRLAMGRILGQMNRQNRD